MINTKNIDKMIEGSFYKERKIEKEINNFNFNSKNIMNNGCYFAFTEGKTDGHDYIKSAVENGAEICIVSDENKIPDEFKNSNVMFFIVENTLKAFQQLAEKYRDEMLQCEIIAITGSNGKTTTKDILYSMLMKKYKTQKTEANYNNHIGVPLTLLNTNLETNYLILEMGMNHFGEIEFLSRMAKPNFAIITNIGESHVENLGSRDGIVKAKSEIKTGLKENGFLLLPGDSDKIEKLKDENKNVKNKIYFGSKENVKNIKDEKYFYENVVNSMKNTRFKTNLFDEDIIMELFGIHNISNALACIIVAKKLGLDINEINEGLKNMVISSMRFENIKTNKLYTIINDAYNASPTSMKASVNTFISLYEKKKKVLILGDMYELGEDEYQLHAEVGQFLNKYIKEIECLITVGEISKKLSSNFKGKKRHFEDKEEVSIWLKNFNSDEFALFFKASRGMKLEEIINKIK